MHRAPDDQVKLDLAPVLLLARRVGTPGLDRVLVETIRDESRPLEVLAEFGDESSVTKSDSHRPQST
jgi:hypothetical protein